MTAKENYVEQNNEIIQALIKKYNAGDGLAPFAIDGIIDPDTWFSLKDNDERILFVLKEAYDNGRDLPQDVDRSHIPPELPYPRLWRLTDYLYGRECTNLCSRKSEVNCSNCRNFKGTYGNCVSWLYAIQNDLTNPDYEHFQQFRNENENARLDLLRKIAVINIKKAKGTKPSNHKDLLKYTKEDADPLRKQIELINPTLIVCGGTFAYFRHLYPKMQKLHPCKNHPGRENYGYTVYDQRKIISMPHPSGCRWYSISGMYADFVANYRGLQQLKTL